MRSTVLVSRILRLLETDGQIGDGTALADAFAEAVESVNRRLEEVDLALLSNQGSEAMRLVEEPPRLLDEVGVLDFPQFSDWVALCGERGWTKAAAIDQTRLEKVLDVSRSATMVEPALKRYRKAMRTNDQELLLQSLRSLADADKSQDWATELRKAEAAAQGKLLAAFRTARDAKDEEGVERAVEALLDGRWSAPPEERIAAEPLAWRRKRDDERRRRELAEDLSLLREVKATWKRARAESLLRHVDELKTFGVAVPKEDEDLVESVRARCDKERAEAEAQARWDAAMEQLRIAVGRGDPDEIQDALAAEAFGERDPEDEVRERAEETLQRFEDAHRRKVRFLAACLLLALCGVLALAGFAFAKKQFETRCLAAVARLQRLVDAPKAHETLAAALTALESEDPKVRRDPRIRTFDDRLKEIVDARDARLAEAERRLGSLAEAETSGWPENAENWDEAIAAAGHFIRDEDVDLRNRLAAHELSFRKTVSERDRTFRKTAEAALSELEKESESLTDEIKTAFSSEKLRKRIEKFQSSASSWKAANEIKVPDLVSRLAGATGGVSEAVRSMDEADKALAAFRAAASIDEFLSARELLRTAFADRTGVSELRDLPADATTVRQLSEGSLPNQVRFGEIRKAPVSDEDFESFKEDNVDVYEEHENWYSQYSVSAGNRVVAISQGPIDIKTDRRNNKDIGVVRGTFLDLLDLSMANTREKPGVHFSKALSPVSREYRDAVDQAAAPDMTAKRFATWIFSRLQTLLEEGHRTFDGEMGTSLDLEPGRLTAYGRVRVMADYLEWLEALGFLSFEKGTPGADVFARIRAKAADVTVDEVDRAFLWACLREPRVSLRNRECAELLKSLPSDCFRQIRSRIAEGRRFGDALGNVGTWKASFVGATAFKPEKPSHLNLDAPKADATKPVYVVRQEGNSAFLKKAFVPSKENAWSIVKGMKEQLLPGEPLFQVERYDKAINPDEEVAKILQSAPPGSAREFETKNFWIEIGK